MLQDAAAWLTGSAAWLQSGEGTEGGEQGERSYVLSTPLNGVVAGRSQECSEKTQRGCWWRGVGNGGTWAALMRTSWKTQTVHHSLCFIPFFSALCLSLVCLFSLPTGRSAVFLFDLPSLSWEGSPVNYSNLQKPDRRRSVCVRMCVFWLYRNLFCSTSSYWSWVCLLMLCNKNHSLQEREKKNILLNMDSNKGFLEISSEIKNKSCLQHMLQILHREKIILNIKN